MHQRLFQKAFFLFIFATLLANAQVRTTGQVSGTVVDPSGAALSAATITARDTSTGLTQSVTANDSGQYVFPSLQPGNYQLTATAPGFAAAVYNDLVVEAGRTKDLEIKMKLGAATEHVEVSASGEVLETTTNTLSSTIDPDEIQNLPLAGRDILPMAELVAGAQSGGDERFHYLRLLAQRGGQYHDRWNQCQFTALPHIDDGLLHFCSSALGRL